MKHGGFWFWLVLFVAGSVLLCLSRPWAEYMGRFVVFVAVFVGISASTRHTATRFRAPRAILAVQFINILPMFLLGWSPTLGSTLKVIYLCAAVVALLGNSYVFFGRERESAA